MRMWLFIPQCLCNQHLKGEHCEMHMFVGTINAGKNIDGYIDTGLLNISFLQQRHDELALFLKNHNSPYTKPDISYLSEDELNSKVDPFQSITELKKRCPKCRGKISSRLRKLKEEYNQKVEELNKKYNEITERLQKGMRTKH